METGQQEEDAQSSSSSSSANPREGASSVGVIRVRSRLILAIVKEKHRLDAAGLAEAYQSRCLDTFLSSDLQKVGVDADLGRPLKNELRKQYEAHILPLTDLGALPKPPKVAEEKPAEPKRRWFFLWLFNPCALPACGS